MAPAGLRSCALGSLGALCLVGISRMRNVAGMLLVLCCPLACNRGSSDSTAAASATVAPAPAASVREPAPVASAAPLSDEAAEKVALDMTIVFMKAAVADKARFPLKDAKTYTAEDDPNNLLGRPGQYLTKVGWKLDGGDATIEVFRNADDAQKRADYVGQIAKSSPMFLQFIYVNPMARLAHA